MGPTVCKIQGRTFVSIFAYDLKTFVGPDSYHRMGTKEISRRLGMVLHTCNPSYVGGRDRRITD
jgi:hypothetical protein